MRRFVICRIGALLFLLGVSNLCLAADEPLASGTPSNASALMAQAAENSYRNAVDEYEGQQRGLDSLYRWSRRLLESNLLAAPNPAARRDAYRSHVARIKQEYEITSVLFRNGRRGGEADKEAGLRFYLAEANLWLLRNCGEEKPTKESVDLATQEVQNKKNAAQRALEASTAAYDAGTVPLDQVYVWSKHLLESTLELAPVNDRIRVYLEHRDRMNQRSAEVSAKHAVGAKGGEPDKYAATLFYLAEADFLQSKSNGQPTSKDVEAFIIAARDAYQETAELYAAGKSDIDTLCLWSTRWMQAIADAGDKEKTSTAYRDHRDRIKKVYEELNGLPPNDRRASTENRQAAQFFLAEAELLVAKHADDNQALPTR